MRLIDADVLIERIKEHKKCAELGSRIVKEVYEMAHEHIIDVVEIQPTAYDIEEVVAELEEEILGKPMHQEFCNGIYRAIEIVRKGGVE